MKNILFLIIFLVNGIFGHGLAFADNNCPPLSQISYPKAEKGCFNDLPISKIKSCI